MDEIAALAGLTKRTLYIQLRGQARALYADGGDCHCLRRGVRSGLPADFTVGTTATNLRATSHRPGSARSWRVAIMRPEVVALRPALDRRGRARSRVSRNRDAILRSGPRQVLEDVPWPSSSWDGAACCEWRTRSARVAVRMPPGRRAPRPRRPRRGRSRRGRRSLPTRGRGSRRSWLDTASRTADASERLMRFGIQVTLRTGMTNKPNGRASPIASCAAPRP